jgi:hypothetical protein
LTLHSRGTLRFTHQPTAHQARAESTWSTQRAPSSTRGDAVSQTCSSPSTCMRCLFPGRQLGVHGSHADTPNVA